MVFTVREPYVRTPLLFYLRTFLLQMPSGRLLFNTFVARLQILVPKESQRDLGVFENWAPEVVQRNPQDPKMLPKGAKL